MQRSQVWKRHIKTSVQMATMLLDTCLLSLLAVARCHLVQCQQFQVMQSERLFSKLCSQCLCPQQPWTRQQLSAAVATTVPCKHQQLSADGEPFVFSGTTQHSCVYTSMQLLILDSKPGHAMPLTVTWHNDDACACSVQCSVPVLCSQRDICLWGYLCFLEGATLQSALVAGHCVCCSSSSSSCSQYLVECR